MLDVDLPALAQCDTQLHYIGDFADISRPTMPLSAVIASCDIASGVSHDQLSWKICLISHSISRLSRDGGNVQYDPVQAIIEILAKLAASD